MTRAFALGALAFALVGCGTVGNFFPGSERAEAITMSPSPARTTPYGGVRVAVKGIEAEHDVALAMFFPFRLADVALSAVGDTLTLPLTVPIAFGYAISDGINDYYFPKTGSTSPAAPVTP